MLRCQDVLAELSDFLDDDLDAAARREIELHLSDCRTCEVLYDSARKALRLVTDSGSFDLPQGLTSRLLERVMDRLTPGAARPEDDSEL